MNRYEYLNDTAIDIRKLTIESIGKLGVGHIGGSLSIVDLLSVLYFDVMNVNPTNPKDENRDRFVLSKGHGGPALYATLALKGYFEKEMLDTLNRPNTNLPSHCDKNLTPGIDMTTGSLGQGFSCAIGIAMGAKMMKKDFWTYVCIGDGESQEGQIWEGAMFAGSQKLGKLIAFTDYNKMQIDGTIEEVNGLYPLHDKWQSFGWHVQVVDGHNVKALRDAIMLAQNITGRPSMIIMDTVKGKGAGFCEGKVSSHNMPITEDIWKQAVKELDEMKVTS
ncbi:transketolase [Bacillus sp. HMF5848]|uniref:transketolase n=1 Tax=Bacillus sp. HMF5848 TaxID=2495421 RepID=UPI000F779628|nr:transketolase [Bacillus sp. HMF5848]RSK25720.1 transketolase [Bacillus sp. HMF5848]